MTEIPKAPLMVLLLPAPALDYLKHILKAYSAAGLPIEEAGFLADLHSRVLKAQTVDFSQLGKAQIDKVGPTGVAVTLKPDEGASDFIHNGGGSGVITTD